MKESTVEDWPDLQERISSFRNRFTFPAIPLSGGGSHRRSNRLLFRGQADREWPVATTLERRKPTKKWRIEEYVLLAHKTHFEVESLTKERWGVPDYKTLKEELQSSLEKDFVTLTLPMYEYLVHIRHLGFPSPLLDWSMSPYVALYFAVSRQTNADAALYCYAEQTGSGRILVQQSPSIYLQGPFVRTSKRHFAQKAWYTLAVQYEASNNCHYFCEHEKAFESFKGQDVVERIVIPARLRSEILRNLVDFNIDEFSLFQTEDALLRAIEMRIFDLGLD